MRMKVTLDDWELAHVINGLQKVAEDYDTWAETDPEWKRDAALVRALIRRLDKETK